MPRGGGDGQAIRDYILVVMRKFEIKKRKGTFMEEWYIYVCVCVCVCACVYIYMYIHMYVYVLL